MKTTTIIFAFVIAFCVGMLALQAALARMERAGSAAHYVSEKRFDPDWHGGFGRRLDGRLCAAGAADVAAEQHPNGGAAGHLFRLPHQTAPQKAAGKDEHSGSELRQHRAIPA